MQKYSLDESIGFYVARTERAMSLRLQAALRGMGCDITPHQWIVLNGLWEKEGVTQNELAERTYKGSSNITRILDQLEKKKIIYRRPCTEDRRSFRIYLTDEGKRLKDDLLPIGSMLLKNASKNITQKEKVELIKILNKIFDAVK